MAFLRFDPKTLSMDVLVGIEETYRPRKDVKELNKSVSSLRDSLNKFILDTWNESCKS